MEDCAKDERSVSNEFMNLNLRGTKFWVPRDIFMKRPQSLLAQLTPESKFYRKDLGEYFFNRNPEIFQVILDYFETDKLHIPLHRCTKSFRCEMDFWNIGYQTMEPCCMKPFTDKEKADQDFQEARDKLMEELYEEKAAMEAENSNVRWRCWKFLEDPHSSIGAKIWGIFMVFVIFVSVITICIDTVPSLRSGVEDIRDDIKNRSQKIAFFVLANTLPSMEIWITQVVTTAILTFDLIVRFIVTPYKLHFCKTLLNLFDALSLLPAWIYHGFLIAGYNPLAVTSIAARRGIWAVMMLRTLRVFSIFRVAKILRYRMLRVIFMALQSSLKELMLTIIILAFLVIVFANGIYWMELPEDTFKTVIEGFWWAIITLTTVGYGDYYPQTTQGKVVGSIAAFTGILMLALPIPIIAGNFQKLYEMDQQLARSSIFRRQDNKNSKDFNENENAQVIQNVKVSNNGTSATSQL